MLDRDGRPSAWPGDTAEDEREKQAIRARFEAAADARDARDAVRARAAEPEPDERPSDSEATRVMVAPRPFGTARDVADKLAGVTPEQPTSNACRTARERTATLASAGAVRIPSPPAVPPSEDPV